MEAARRKLGPYILVRKIGRGAFGVVWLAEKQTAIATTQFALKLARDEDIDLEAFKREAAIWVHASGHPNVVSLIEADIYDDQVVLVSEYVPDGSLATWLKQHGGQAPSIESACEMIDGVLAGLAHLHERRIIHRDLKPDNILLRRDTPHLADFGIARLLRSGSYSTNISGTLAYMAPEAFDGKRTEQTDIWAVGVILYQLLSGRLPYPHQDTVSFIGAIMRNDPSPLPDSVPEAFRRIVMKALQRDPSQRYSSAAEMQRELRDAGRMLWLKGHEVRDAKTSSITESNKQDNLPPTIPAIQPNNIKTILAPFSPVLVPEFGPEETQVQGHKRRFVLTDQGSAVLFPVLAWGAVGLVSGLLSALVFNSQIDKVSHGSFPGIIFGIALFLFGEWSSSPPLGRRNPVLSFVILTVGSTLGWQMAVSIGANQIAGALSFVLAGGVGGIFIVLGEMVCWRKTLDRWKFALLIVTIAALSGFIATATGSTVEPLIRNSYAYSLFATWQGIVLASHAVASSRNKKWLLSSIAVVTAIAGVLFIVVAVGHKGGAEQTSSHNVNSPAVTSSPSPTPTPDKAQLQRAVDSYLTSVAKKVGGNETDKSLRKTVDGDLDGDGDDDAVVQFVLDAKEGNSSAVLLAVFINSDGKFRGMNAEVVGGNHLRDFELDSVQVGTIIGNTLECDGDQYPCENEMKRQASILWKDNKLVVPDRWPK